MINSFDISFIICSNGYGHLKRVHSVCIELIKKLPKIKIAFHINEKNYDFFQKNLSIHSNISCITDTLMNEINWNEADKNTLAKRNSWIHDLTANPVLQNSKMIISDNHVLPIEVYNETILMGSFLWHHVFNHPLSESFIKDSETIKRLKPSLLCIGEMVMTEAVNETSTIGLPWFCKKENVNNRVVDSAILITCGGTTFIRKQVIDIIENLILYIKNNIKIYLDEGLYTNIPLTLKKDVYLFDFKPDSFLKLMAIVCRPGIGILNECVAYNVPAFAINIENNREICHNAIRIEELGYGVKNNSIQTQEIANEISLFLFRPNELEKYRKNLKTAKDGGAQMAAQYLLNKLNNE